MDAPREDDVVLLEDEKFDFDLSLSSTSANEEEDEVFFGPVGHRERCLAASVELRLQPPEQPAPPRPSPSPRGPWPWCPLTGDAFVEVYKEAHLLALQIESARKAASALPAQPPGQAGEHFVQEPEAKISLFEREEEARRSPQALKRETFCVSDRTDPAPLPVPLGPAPSQTAAQRMGAGRQLPRAPSLRLRALEKALRKTLLKPPGAATRKPSTSGAAPATAGQAARRSLSWSSRAPQTGGARRRESSLGPRPGVSSALAEPFKVPRSPAGEPPGTVTPQFPRTQRPQPHTPAGRTPLHSTPAPSSAISQAGTPSATRRLSSLPTPAGRRLSSLPRATPRTTFRAPGSPPCASETPGRGPLRTSSACVSNSQAASSGRDSSPDGSSSPPATVPQALCFSPEHSEGTKSPSAGRGPEALPAAVAPQAASAPLVEVDAPLIDFCSSPLASAAPGGPSRPLIDLLVNTPDWARGSTPKARPDLEAVQLIDLASPLIQLSPAADKENVASPLLKL
ncbi:G2 and S phase-expressed protein 1 [Sorex fumeus]|uniref:G2 and S phase-expressed protein 1 n=1 Tax=Sorex fumeus TaxID=62283 RepID=UPI0024ADD106|nr:G2 and S phase-expressed protein 1 [Sorex fumeus]